jgi:hypothetical protein
MASLWKLARCAAVLAVSLSFAVVARGDRHAEAQEISEPDTDPVVGPAHSKLERLFPHARGVFLAQVDSIRRRDASASDGLITDERQFHVLAQSGVVPNALVWVLGGGFIKRDYNKPLPKAVSYDRLKARPLDFVTGRAYWFVTADRADGEFYPLGIMGYWPADSLGPPDVLHQAVATDAYRWQIALWLPDQNTSVGWLGDPADTSLSFRVWSDTTLLWEQRASGTPYQYFDPITLARAGSLGTYRPPFVEADSVMLVITRVRQDLLTRNEYGIREGAWGVVTIYREYSGTRLAVAIEADKPGGEEIERLYREYDPGTGRLVYERVQDTNGSGLKPVGLPPGTWRRKVERWIDPSSGRVQREVVSADAGGWKVVDHDIGIAASPVGCSSR